MIASLPFWFQGKLNTKALQECGCVWMKNEFKVGTVLRSFVYLQNLQNPVPLNSKRNTQTTSFCQSLPPVSLAMCQGNICFFLPQLFYSLTFIWFLNSHSCDTSQPKSWTSENFITLHGTMPLCWPVRNAFLLLCIRVAEHLQIRTWKVSGSCHMPTRQSLSFQLNRTSKRERDVITSTIPVMTTRVIACYVCPICLPLSPARFYTMWDLLDKKAS